MRGAGEGEGIADRLVKDRRPFFRQVVPITDHPFPTRKAWRVGYHVMEIGVSVHTVVLRLPDNGRNLVAPERANPWLVISPTSTPGATGRCHSPNRSRSVGPSISPD